MISQLPYSNTKTSKFQNSNLFTFVATLSGVVVGVMASLAMVGPMVHSEVASATNAATRTISTRPADLLTDCSTGVGGGGAAGNAAHQFGSVLGASSFLPNNTPGGNGGGGTTFVHKLVSGIWATNTATISGNGADSTNKVVTVNKNTTTISNDNDIHLTNNNPQTATSGDAKSYENTDSNANATSGTASNTSDSSMNVSVTN